MIESNIKGGQQRCRSVKLREGLLDGICEGACNCHLKRTQVRRSSLKIGEALQAVCIIRAYGHGDIQRSFLRPFNEDREHVRKLAIPQGGPQLRSAQCDLSPSATRMCQRYNFPPCPDERKYPFQNFSGNLMN